MGKRRISRRRFLEGTGAALAAAAVSPSLKGQSRPPGAASTGAAAAAPHRAMRPQNVRANSLPLLIVCPFVIERCREHPARGERTSAPVTRLDEARPRRSEKPAPRPAQADDGGHLPAFLLRPVRAKA